MRLLLVLVGTVLLAACGAFSSMAELEGQSSATADALQKDLGVKPHIGWHYYNGKLTNVNVNFDFEKVELLTVGQLESRVRAAVVSNFKDKPEQIIVSVSTKP
jgi:major membrane immunogen (membrane-anchored lipoprotein)